MIEIKDTDGYKEFREAFVKLKQGFIGMSSDEKTNRNVKHQISNIESEIEALAEIEYKEEC